MENHDFDVVKAEKANAIAKFRRVRNITKLFQLLEVFLALTFISWSSTRLPSAFSLCLVYLIEFSTYLLNPHVVFVIGNVIVIALYVLSRNFEGVESDFASDSGIVSDEYIKCSKIDHNNSAGGVTSEIAVLTPQLQSVTEKSGAEDKQIVCLYNTVRKTECEEAAVVIETATKQLQRFQRTQSEKLKREISLKPLRKEFRRSETEHRRPEVVSPNHGRRALTSFETVDKLSNEEFRLTVEAFIEKQQSFLKSQRFAEISQ